MSLLLWWWPAIPPGPWTLTEGESRDIVFFLPRFVVPGTLGPTMLEVYLMISVSGGSRTPPRMPLGSLEQRKALLVPGPEAALPLHQNYSYIYISMSIVITWLPCRGHCVGRRAAPGWA